MKRVLSFVAVCVTAVCLWAEVSVVPAPQNLVETGGTCPADTKVVVVRDASVAAEGYRLEIRPASVTLTCSDGAGEAYGRETLRQLRVDGKNEYVCCDVADAPRYPWRGFMLDEARHFFGKGVVKSVIDQLVRHKMNVLHWHLVDDQGWRLEIKGHPELVEFGATRPQSVKVGAKPAWPNGELSYELDGERYGPFFYTQEDVREILAYAKARHVRVVPEIEMPGHVRALLAAHPELSCVGEKLPRVPRLFWSIEDDVLCAGNDGAVRLMEEILDEVCELFAESPVIHIGGDECPKMRWKTCAKCQARIKEKGLKDEKALQAWLVTHICRYLEEKGRRVLGWDEVLEGDIPSSTIAMSWRTSRHGPGVMSAAEAARRGHDVVCTPNTVCYLDHAQGIADDPHAYYWDSPVTVKRCYWFDPSEGVAEADRRHVLGGQANCWSESMFNRYDLEWKAWPRACAIAEVLWTGAERRDWADFARRLSVHVGRLRRDGVNAASFESEDTVEPENVPELMKTFADDPVASVEDWEKVRKPELKKYFLENMYGERPAAAEKPDVSFSPEGPDKVMMDGKAVRKLVRVTYRGPYGTNSFVLTAFIPRQERPAPAFVLMCNRNAAKNINPDRVNVKRDAFWPAEQIVARGYAAVAFFNGDVAVDNYNPATAFLSGVFSCYERPQDRTDTSWGTLSAWAWGASRAMDWIEREPLIDAKHVGVVGHSRSGKAALVAGVTDERFAMTCSNCSGCGGAKLANIDLPESEFYAAFGMSRVTYWFCGGFQRYFVNRDRRIFDHDAVPHLGSNQPLAVDQHAFVALIAPRLLAIGSASEDSWAGPLGEYHTARLASPAWELYGRKGLGEEGCPPEMRPLVGGDVSYHIRAGKHNLTPYDWSVYMDFADAHGWRGTSAR